MLVTSRYLLCCLQCCLTFNVNNRGCFTHCFTSIIQKQITLNECIIVVDCNKMEAFLKASVIQLTLSYSNRYYSNLFIIRLNSKSPSILKAQETLIIYLLIHNTLLTIQSLCNSNKTLFELERFNCINIPIKI